MSTTHELYRTDSPPKAPEIVHVEEAREDVPEDIEKGLDVSEAPVNIDEGYDPDLVKRTVRKIDWRLLPILAAMYSVSIIDRANLGLARAANNFHMDKELGTNQGNRYSTITIVFFVTYMVFEFPSQFGLRAFGARWWLGSACMAWGLVMIGMGYVHDWQSLAGLRALLGLFESALFPGAAYLISCWYPRNALATRTVVFYASSSIMGAMSYPLAYVFTLLHGRLGHSGWRWMFTMYGLLTSIVALFAYVFIVDFPDKARFLTDEQKELVHTRIERDRNDADPDTITVRKFVVYLLDWHIWVAGFFLAATSCAGYSLTYFLPSILASMGFAGVEVMVLGAPPYVWSLVPALSSAYIADKWRGCRAAVIIFNALSIILGTCLYSQLDKSNMAGRYVGVFIAVGGATANIPLVVAWSQTMIRSQSKRAYASAFVSAWSGVGGILSGVVFLQREAKKGYPTGIWFTIAVNAAVIAGSVLLALWLRYRNRLADLGRAVLEGDPDFRYQY